MTGLPAGWASARVGELVAEDGITDGPFGSNLKTSHYRESGPRVIRLQNVGDGVFRDERAHIEQEHFERLAKHAVLPGDVLIASLGETLPRACQAPDLGPAIVKADVIRARTASGVSSTYLMWALNSPLVRERVAKQIKGVGRPRFSLGGLRVLEVPLAPAAEQERIVAAIEEAVSLLEAGETALHNTRTRLKRMRESVLTAAITGQLVSQDPSDTPAPAVLAEGNSSVVVQAPGLPRSWIWVRLGSVASDVRNGVFASRPSAQPPGIPILRIGAVRPMALDMGDFRYADLNAKDPAVARAFITGGDLLFTRYNGNPEFVGACAAVPPSIGRMLHPDKLIRVRVDAEIALPRFVQIAASAGASRTFTRSVTKTTAGQAGISGSDLKRMPLPLPPLAEQARIVAEVERQFSFIEAAERAVDVGLERSKGLRRSVLKAAFEGRLVEHDPSDEPASLLLDRIAAAAAASKKRAPRRARRKVKAS